MSLRRILSGDPARTSLLYLAIGGLSLAKAIAVRNDSERFRRELVDAALFIGVGLALRRFSSVRARKREEIVEAVPNWVLDRARGETGRQGRARRRLRRRRKSEPEPTLGERARRLLTS